MLCENLKHLRTQRDLSQEDVAMGLHVVRQTVSKWEKGLSVPDADMLKQLAELFDVSVGDLLGEETVNSDISEIALQLGLLNEQMANRERRTRAIWKWILAGALVVLGLWLIVIYGETYLAPRISSDIVMRLACTLGEETYYFSIDCDGQYRIMSYGGDPWIHDHVLQGSTHFGYREVHASVLIELIEEYFAEHGGTVEVQKLDPKTIKPAWAISQE